MNFMLTKLSFYFHSLNLNLNNKFFFVNYFVHFTFYEIFLYFIWALSYIPFYVGIYLDWNSSLYNIINKGYAGYKITKLMVLEPPNELSPVHHRWGPHRWHNRCPNSKKHNGGTSFNFRYKSPKIMNRK